MTAADSTPDSPIRPDRVQRLLSEYQTLRRRYGLLIVGRLRTDGTVAINPSPNDTIHAGSMLIVLGRRDDLDRFADDFSLR